MPDGTRTGYTPGRSVTRVDADGVPMVVQRLFFDKKSGLYCAHYFDGSHVILSSWPRIAIFGYDCVSTSDDYARMEAEATERYLTMAAVQNSISPFRSFANDATVPIPANPVRSPPVQRRGKSVWIRRHLPFFLRRTHMD